MENTTADSTSGGKKYKAVENNNKILLIPLRCMDDHDYLLLSDIQALVPTATAILSDGKMIPFEIDTNSLLELSPKRILVKETDVIWQVYSPDPPANNDTLSFQQRTIQLEHKFDQLIQRLDQLVYSSTEQGHHQDNNSIGSVTDAETNTTADPSINTQHQSQSGPASSIPTNNTSTRRSASPPPAFSSSPALNHINASCPVVSTTSTTSSSSVAPRLPPPSISSPSTSSTPSSPSSTSSHSSSSISASVAQERTTPAAVAATVTTSDFMDNMAGPSTSTHIIARNSQQHANTSMDLTTAPPPSYETSIFGTIQALTQHIRRFEHHIPNRHKSPRWLARRAGWLGYEPTTIEQVAYQLVQLEMALLWTAVTESWIQERETWLTLVASARTERHLAGALVNLERHTLVLDEAWQDVRDEWTRDLLEVIVSVGF